MKSKYPPIPAQTLLAVRFPDETVTVDQLVARLQLTAEDVGHKPHQLWKAEDMPDGSAFELWVPSDKAHRFLDQPNLSGAAITFSRELTHSRSRQNPWRWTRRMWRSLPVQYYLWRPSWLRLKGQRKSLWEITRELHARADPDATPEQLDEMADVMEEAMKAGPPTSASTDELAIKLSRIRGDLSTEERINKQRRFDELLGLHTTE